MATSRDHTPHAPPELPADAHKGIAGRVLLAAGSEWMPGAAILTARAAQRAGAGLVGVVVTEDMVPATLPIAAPEAVLVPWDDVEFDEERWHACLVGPGLGLDDSEEMVEWLIEEAPIPLVVDADALTILAEDLSLTGEREAPTVLTPHAGEAARLLGREIPADPVGRLAAAHEIALKTRSICCLKGRRTVVTDGTRVYVNETGDNTLATAGSGDVLAGIATAYLALTVTVPSPRWSAFDAVTRAVWVHGRAGDLARAARLSRSVIASDLVETLSAAQKT